MTVEELLMLRVSVSKRAISLVDAAVASLARPPTMIRIAGSRRRRSASLTSSYPARRLKIDCRSKADRVCWLFCPARESSRVLAAVVCARASGEEDQRQQVSSVCGRSWAGD